MANMISVNVYDFKSSGNKYAAKRLMGLPSAGAVVDTASSPDPRVYVYSKITYPALGLGGPEYLTAETVAQIITKINA